jgi:hypothetical protein
MAQEVPSFEGETGQLVKTKPAALGDVKQLTITKQICIVWIIELVVIIRGFLGLLQI